jgi:hypothetical protein
MEVMLLRVDPRWPGAWDQLAPYLEAALVRGGGDTDWSLDDIYKAAEREEVALWGGVKDQHHVFGAAVTRITAYPRRHVLEVLAMGADPDHESDWMECLAQLSDLARHMGATAIIGTGRPGWARKLGAQERRVFELPLCTP